MAIEREDKGNCCRLCGGSTVPCDSQQVFTIFRRTSSLDGGAKVTGHLCPDCTKGVLDAIEHNKKQEAVIEAIRAMGVPAKIPESWHGTSVAVTSTPPQSLVGKW